MKFLNKNLRIALVTLSLSCILTNYSVGQSLPVKVGADDTPMTVAEECTELKQRIAQDPNNSLNYYQLALCHFARLEHNDAVENCEKAIELSPENTLYRQTNAQILADFGFYYQAIESIDAAIELDETKAEYFADRANYKHRLKFLHAAIRDFSKAIELDPEMVRAYVGRAEVHFAINHYKKAIADADKSIELDPANSKAYSIRGMSKHVYLDNVGAMEDYNLAVETNPNNADAWLNRGVLHLELYQLEAALIDLSQSIEIEPNAESYRFRAKTNLELENYREARNDYRELVRFNETDRLVITQIADY